MNDLELEALFTPFADPATTVNCTPKASAISIEITRNGTAAVFNYTPADGRVQLRRGKKFFPSIDSLLTSESFANLNLFAANQSRLLEKNADSKKIVPRLRIVEKGATKFGLPALEQCLIEPALDKTRIFLIDGPAGIGKTTLIEDLTRKWAVNYLARTVSAPILYVTNRGQRLSSLRGKVAEAIQIARGAFTFDQVPPLFKRGLLRLAIDGFDEMVDADGYEDAWYALKHFLADLSGGGICILAGRDTFFDDLGFLDRLDDLRQQIELVQVHIDPATPGSAKKFLIQSGWDPALANDPIADELFQPDSYILRPYSLATLAEAKGWDAAIKASTIRKFLVDSFLRREANLILSLAGQKRPSTEDIEAALAEIFCQAALDMSERESTEVDLEYIAMLCEMFFVELLAPEDLRKLKHKAGSIALLEQSKKAKNMRRFPHSEILYYFLAKGILKELYRKKVPLALRRGILGADFQQVFQDCLEEESDSAVLACLQFLENSLQNERSSDRLTQNGGGLLLASLTRPLSGAPRRVQDLIISECTLSGSAASAELSGVDIFRLDVRDADLSRVKFKETTVTNLIANKSTRFGVSRPSVSTLSFVDEIAEGESKVYRQPAEIENRLLELCPKPDVDLPRTPLSDLLARVCLRSIRQFYLCPGGDDPAAFLLREPEWPTLEMILDEHGRIERKTVQRSGNNTQMLHIRAPRQLLEKVDEEALRIWQHVHATASKA